MAVLKSTITAETARQHADFINSELDNNQFELIMKEISSRISDGKYDATFAGLNLRPLVKKAITEAGYHVGTPFSSGMMESSFTINWADAPYNK